MNWFYTDGYEFMTDDGDNPDQAEKKEEKNTDPQKAGGHHWLQTGMVKTWCKKCKAEGHWDMGQVQTSRPFCTYRYWESY